MKIVFLGNFSVSYSSENHHKKTLENLDHEVIPFQEGVATADEILLAAQYADMFVWVHTHGWQTTGTLTMPQVLLALKNGNVPTVTYHLDLWFGLDRQKDLEQDDFYKHIGYFFTVDKLMADWFNENTEVKGHYLQAAVFEEECRPTHMFEKKRDVIFVGSKGYHHEWQYRPQLIDRLADTYRDQFTHIGGDGIGTIRGEQLNAVYQNAKVAVGDSLCLNFDYPYYWSDRVYETLGRGGFIIHPYIKGMEEHFTDTKHLVFYKFGDFEELRHKINFYLEHDNLRERIRAQGQRHVKNHHTYRQRWEHIIKTVKEDMS